MPYPNFHAARITDPSKYDEFRTFTPEGFPAGLSLILGIKDGKSEAQAVRADKEKWTTARFKQWLKDNSYEVILFEPAMRTNSKAAKAMQSYFSAWTPLDLMKAEEKGDGEENRAYIEGIISSDSVDQQGDIIKQDGLDFSYFLRRGYLNDDHKQGAANIVGQPISVYRTKLQDGTPATAMKGYLYLNKPNARQIYDTAIAMKSAGSDRRLGFSIEGAVEARDPKNPSVITKARVLHVAVTAAPCNTDASNMELVQRSLAYYNSLASSAGSGNGDMEVEQDPMLLELARQLLQQNPELARMELLQAMATVVSELQDSSDKKDEVSADDDSMDDGSIETLDAEEDSVATMSYDLLDSSTDSSMFNDKDSSMDSAEDEEDSLMDNEEANQMDSSNGEDAPAKSNIEILSSIMLDKMKGDLAIMMNEALSSIVSLDNKGNKPIISSSQLAQLLLNSFPHLSNTQAKTLAVKLVSAAKNRYN